MNKECNECKHRRMFRYKYPCNECIRNPNIKGWTDYFDKKIKLKQINIKKKGSKGFPFIPEGIGCP